jgi:RNA recognition motif-containing protein
MDCKPFLMGSELKTYGKVYQKRRVYIENLPAGCNDELLKQFFLKYGSIENCYMLKDSESGSPLNQALVLYKKVSHAEKLLKSVPI